MPASSARHANRPKASPAKSHFNTTDHEGSRTKPNVYTIPLKPLSKPAASPTDHQDIHNEPAPSPPEYTSTPPIIPVPTKSALGRLITFVIEMATLLFNIAALLLKIFFKAIYLILHAIEALFRAIFIPTSAFIDL